MLDEVLQFGSDQLAIACAFCTAAGVDILLRHASRLKRRGSFVVVAAAPPTDYADLNRLYEVIGDNLLVHWGCKNPREKDLGVPLMHSKVFYARSGQQCRLWTGSHNLTASATQGLNCEAAIVMAGDSHEQVFVDALAHLMACRDQAVSYDPDLEFLEGEKADILVIHAETAFIPTKPTPWHVEVCLNSEDCDTILKPPAEVRLYLYDVGVLSSGMFDKSPLAAYSGFLTGVNFTQRNKSTIGQGTPAEWQEADFQVTDKAHILNFHDTEPPDPGVTTQAVVNIEAEVREVEYLFSSRPCIRRVYRHSSQRVQVDDDMWSHFVQSEGMPSNMVIRQPILSAEQVVHFEPRKGGPSLPGDYRSIGVRRLEMMVKEKPPRADAQIKPKDLLERIKWRIGNE